MLIGSAGRPAVTGVDISGRHPSEARMRGPRATFLVRHSLLVADSTFDLAVCLFTSIGYFDDSADDRVIASAATTLSPEVRSCWTCVCVLLRIRNTLVPFEVLLDGVLFRIREIPTWMVSW